MANSIDNSEDYISVSDITDRVEELRTLREDTPEGEEYDDASEEELSTLEGLLNELKGYGGDYQWEGDWYPGYLIRATYFTEAMKELLSDIGGLPVDLPAYLAIDWDKTADNLKVDYSSVEYDGVEYFYR